MPVCCLKHKRVFRLSFCWKHLLQTWPTRYPLPPEKTVKSLRVICRLLQCETASWNLLCYFKTKGKICAGWSTIHNVNINIMTQILITALKHVLCPWAGSLCVSRRRVRVPLIWLPVKSSLRHKYWSITPVNLYADRMAYFVPVKSYLLLL